MKKLLLIIAAMTVMASCSSEKKNAEKCADFEKRIEQAEAAGDYEKVEQITKEFDAWFDSLSKEEQEALLMK